ncbi:hypothetical protein N658DRAFT_140486 [Parathielavia hyrcaniae]|uniref:Uncharacterized protein n=1 Tax=Parathielavia hyrcaniae TaxID=113614 RepID=A0AAN6PY85_9PEZI|nr:hypothetical protein N658DRAFT_140486 [Parathielavia hyrcaniae]
MSRVGLILDRLTRRTIAEKSKWSRLYSYLHHRAFHSLLLAAGIALMSVSPPLRFQAECLVRRRWSVFTHRRQ